MEHLEIINYLKSNENWREDLQNKPYYLTIKDKGNLVLFKYNQIKSDLAYNIVQEARDLILEKDTWKVVRFAFKKFFNYGESKAASIDYGSLYVEEKIDGSLISLYYYNDKWNVASNGCIDAQEAGLQFPTEKYKSLYDLFVDAAKDIDYNKLNKNYTYTFELVSKYNKVVIPYKITKIYHIGTRCNLTFLETITNIGVEHPKLYDIMSLEKIIEISKTLPFDKEGYVVIDKNWNRVKVKSPAYVAIHHLTDNGKISLKRLLKCVIKNEKEEFLTYFPEFKEDYEKIEYKFDTFYARLVVSYSKMKTRKFNTRKEFAQWAKQEICPEFLFKLKDGKVDNIREFISSLSIVKLENLIMK